LLWRLVQELKDSNDACDRLTKLVHDSEQQRRASSRSEHLSTSGCDDCGSRGSSRSSACSVAHSASSPPGTPLHHSTCRSWHFTLPPSRRVRTIAISVFVCLWLCVLSVRSHISKTTWANFTEAFVHVTYMTVARYSSDENESVVRQVVVCLHVMGQAKATWMRRMLKVTHQVAARIGHGRAKSDILN